jgi:hypothetical protein
MCHVGRISVVSDQGHKLCTFREDDAGITNLAQELYDQEKYRNTTCLIHGFR